MSPKPGDPVRRLTFANRTTYSEIRIPFATPHHCRQVFLSVDVPAASSSGSRRTLCGLALGLLITLAIVIPVEWQRFQNSESIFDLLFHINVDTTLYMLLLVLLPLCWWGRPIRLSASLHRLVNAVQTWLAESPSADSERGDGPASGIKKLRAWTLALTVAIMALLASFRVSGFVVDEERGLRFGDLPPAIHDEYSYLFQAETFRAGRWSWPSHPDVPRVFDQMHVLNEGRFASRYFPGTGAWIAPWLSMGNPYLGHHIATALTCLLVFAVGRELGGNGAGLLAGFLAALAPSLNLFANLLLAHQPALVGILLFVYAFLRLWRLLNDMEPTSTAEIESSGPGSVKTILGWSLASGAGLAFAMLCRPMSAAGIGLPAGAWLLFWIVRHAVTRRRTLVGIVAGYAIPLLIAFVILGWQNWSTTGRVLRTPYQEYTERLTPRHMYGFDNVTRARPFEQDNPRVLKRYNEWATNLDGHLALKNMGFRFLASWQWTLGVVPLVLLTAVFLVAAARNLDVRWWLIPSAIVSLHAAHVPYWYDGIQHWHYVFESNVLWCLLAAGGTVLLVRCFRHQGRPWMNCWIGGVLVAGVLVNQAVFSPVWTQSRLAAGVNEFAFSRLHYRAFREILERQVTERPAIVLVRHKPDDISIDYVSNHPSLTGDVLIGRLPADNSTSEAETIDSVQRALLKRSVYVFDAATGRLQLAASSTGGRPAK